MAAAFGAAARVNGVAPGLVIPTDDYSDCANGAAGTRNAAGCSYPIAQSVAEAVLYLAKARDVTGQIMFVDGGANLKSLRRFHASLTRQTVILCP